jgi:hypothetical protein
MDDDHVGTIFPCRNQFYRINMGNDQEEMDDDHVEMDNDQEEMDDDHTNAIFSTQKSFFPDRSQFFHTKIIFPEQKEVAPT